MEDKAYQIIKKFPNPSYTTTENDLKEIFQGILRTQGALLDILNQNIKHILPLIIEKLVEIDKQFYSALFTVIKQSLKWKNGRQLIISMIPTLISINVIENDEMVEVLLLTIYNEFYEQLNQGIISTFQFEELPSIKQKYDLEFKELKKGKRYSQITEINQNNLQEIHQMLLELILQYLFQLDTLVLKQIIRLGFIFCGVKFTQEELKSSIYYKQNHNIFQVQLTDKSLEALLSLAISLSLQRKDIKNTGLLIELIRKKATNECRFNIASLAQSAKDITQNIYDGVF